MTEWASGNIYIRPSGLLQAGVSVGGHVHKFDHTTIVFTGSVRVRKWVMRVHPSGEPMLDEVGEEIWVIAVEREYTAPSHFLVEANASHDIMALKDGTQYWCVYSHRNAQGEVTQEQTGWPSYG